MITKLKTLLLEFELANSNNRAAIDDAAWMCHLASRCMLRGSFVFPEVESLVNKTRVLAKKYNEYKSSRFGEKPSSLAPAEVAWLLISSRRQDQSKPIGNYFLSHMKEYLPHEMVS